jgi:GWxTD domain-containing protein
MASSAISRLIAVFVLAVFSLATSAQCNLDKQTPTSHSGSQYSSPSPNYAAWLNQDVRWIITDEERAAFKHPRSDEEREQFVRQFWLRRDPTPETFLNEFKQEHYRRMLYANEHFATADTPGWRTDRGRIYILYGKPDQVTAEDGKDERAETWEYRYIDGIGQLIHIRFVDRCWCGSFVQVTDLDQAKASQSSGVTIIDPVVVPLGTVPVFQFRDLDELVTHRICMALVPMSVFNGQVRITDYTVLMPITMRVQNEDVTWSTGSKERRKTLNLYGRITSQRGRIEEIFEKAVSHNSDQAYEDFTFLYVATLLSDTYRINVAVKDVAGDRKGTWSGTITVP